MAARRRCVAAVPLASAGRIVEALTLARDETLARQQYADAMQRILAHLAEGFRAGRGESGRGALAHRRREGRGLGTRHDLGDEWAATAQSLPATAQYVALGHIHRPQRVEAAGRTPSTPARRMQLDFGEVDDEKSFVVIEVAAGRRRRESSECRTRAAALGHWAGTIAELERDADSLQALRLPEGEDHARRADADLNRRARQILPNIVVVDAVLPDPTLGSDRRSARATAVAPLDQFRAFYQREHQREPTPPTLDLFSELYRRSLRVTCVHSVSKSKASPAIATASAARLLGAVAVRHCRPDRRRQVEHPRHDALRALRRGAAHRQAGHRRVHLARPRRDVRVPRLPCAWSRLPGHAPVEAQQTGALKTEATLAELVGGLEKSLADAVKPVNEEVVRCLGSVTTSSSRRSSCRRASSRSS